MLRHNIGPRVARLPHPLPDILPALLIDRSRRALPPDDTMSSKEKEDWLFDRRSLCLACSQVVRGEPRGLQDEEARQARASPDGQGHVVAASFVQVHVPEARQVQDDVVGGRDVPTLGAHAWPAPPDPTEQLTLVSARRLRTSFVSKPARLIT
jgi:hypothetical protein